MNVPLRIVLADRQVLFLDVLRSVLTAHGHDVLTAATSRVALMDAVGRTRPDCCLMDSRLSDGDAIAVIGRLQAIAPTTRLIVLSADSDSDVLHRALEVGAHGFVHKSRGLAAVLDALLRVAAGEQVITGPLVRRPDWAASATGGNVPHLAAYLTPRELECLCLLTSGLATVDMSRRLGVSLTTVRSHVQSILTKLGAHSRREAAALALRHGLVRDISARPA
jgi:two-component system nitrate/nitrite response regulator NarL